KQIVAEPTEGTIYIEGGLKSNNASESKMVGKEQLPKPPQMKKQPGRNREPNFNSYISNRGGGRGSRGGRGEASGGRGQSNAARFQANTERGESSGGRGRTRGEEVGRSGYCYRYHANCTNTRTIHKQKPSVAATETTPRGKTIEVDVAEPPKLKKQGRKRKVAEPSAAEPPFRIYHKNRGRSERIFNQKMKKTVFGPNGKGSTADKAFSL
ncbi:hypothetical protein Tco_0542643, partial [Tanacetum coccineum]